MTETATSSSTDLSHLRTAVLIPCFNEAATIAKVVEDFSKQLANARIYVYDNNSTDGTARLAAEAGAIVRREPRQGKGHVIRRMFADIEADVYIMVDGDGTYDPSAAPFMLEKLVKDNLDMVNGARIEQESRAYRPGHKMGNKLFTRLVQLLFGNEFRDMLSGYRVFSRRFVKSFPQSSGGFEIETELTIHALELQMPTAEIETPYRSRITGSKSKLNTYSDGLRILRTIIRLVRLEKPFAVFSFFGILLLLASGILMYPVFVTYFETGLVPRFPTLIFSTGIALSGFLSFTVGLVLDTVTRGRQEAKRMRYLQIPSTLSLLHQHDRIRG